MRTKVLLSRKDFVDLEMNGETRVVHNLTGEMGESCPSPVVAFWSLMGKESMAARIVLAAMEGREGDETLTRIVVDVTARQVTAEYEKEGEE